MMGQGPVKNILKELHNFHVSDHKIVCLNHFEFGKLTFASSVPTLFLTVSNLKKSSPLKRKLQTCQQTAERTKLSAPSHHDIDIHCCIIDPISAEV